MNSYEEVAVKHNMDPYTKKRFLQYMRTRWLKEESFQCLTGYASEWAERFLTGREMQCSDREGQSILVMMARQEAK